MCACRSDDAQKECAVALVTSKELVSVLNAVAPPLYNPPVHHFIHCTEFRGHQI